MFCVAGEYFGCVSMQACRFFVAGAALCDAAFRDFVAGTAFCDAAKMLFERFALSGTRKHDAASKIVAGAAFSDCLEKWQQLRKIQGFWGFVTTAS